MVSEPMRLCTIRFEVSDVDPVTRSERGEDPQPGETFWRSLQTTPGTKAPSDNGVYRWRCEARLKNAFAKNLARALSRDLTGPSSGNGPASQGKPGKPLFAFEFSSAIYGSMAVTLLVIGAKALAGAIGNDTSVLAVLLKDHAFDVFTDLFDVPNEALARPTVTLSDEFEELVRSQQAPVDVRPARVEPGDSTKKPGDDTVKQPRNETRQAAAARLLPSPILALSAFLFLGVAASAVYLYKGVQDVWSKQAEVQKLQTEMESETRKRLAGLEASVDRMRERVETAQRATEAERNTEQVRVLRDLHDAILRGETAPKPKHVAVRE